MTSLPLLIAAALASPALASAADFAPKGAPATLVVDFSYDAVGKQANRLDLHEWRVKRTVHVEAQLVAQAPAAWGSAGPDAGQSAQLGRAQAQVGQAGAAMAPLMAGVQAVMAKCGDDDACIERETARLGAGMAGSPQVAAAQKAGAAAAAATTPGAPRVQQWLGRAQKGSYAIAETEHRVHADPICLKLPGGRCTRDEQRQGSGALPLAQGSLASVEIDTGRGQLTVQLPMVPDLLPFTETITTEEPEGTHETPTPRGPQRRELLFAQGPGQQPSMKPFTVPLAGSGRSQSGERVVKFDGPGAEGGTLTVRWRFVAP